MFEHCDVLEDIVVPETFSIQLSRTICAGALFIQE